VLCRHTRPQLSHTGLYSLQDCLQHNISTGCESGTQLSSTYATLGNPLPAT
jgi:hypothetical protein